MKKIVIQGAIIIIIVFFGTWISLTEVDWIKVFEVQKTVNKTEQKLGELFLETFEKTENKNILIVNAIDTIVTHICTENKIDREKIKIHVLNKNEINAFAMPNGHLIVYSGLILNAAIQEELTGVICHEIAHIELNHVMKKLVKEIGLTVLISMATGNDAAEIIKETVKMLSSSAFDRSLEKEADIKAVDYLIRAKVNPEPFANFLYKLSLEDDAKTEYLKWVSNHPASKERAEYIIEHSKNKLIKYEPILSIETWNKLKIELTE